MSEITAIEKVNEFERRIAEFLPGSQMVPKPIRLAMAQVAIAHGLDPFLKEVWPIPQKNRAGEITGWDLMIGIAGWRAAAHRSNEYWGRRFEKCTAEERAWLGAQPNDIAIRCIVMRRKTSQKPMEFDGYGLFRTGHEYTKMNPLQCARYRAERDAMKAAFPISLPPGVQARIADEDTGEVINGTHSMEWAETISTQQDATIIDQEPDILDELTQSAEHDVVSNAPVTESPREPTPAPERKSYRVAAVKFDAKMTTGNWHERCAEFAANNENWQKDDMPDMNHILASAGHAGYQFITSENVFEVFGAIIAAHEAKE